LELQLPVQVGSVLSAFNFKRLAAAVHTSCLQTVNIHISRDAKKGIVNNQIIDWSFKLDGIMHNANQETVFATTTTDVVTAALDGYNGRFLPDNCSNLWLAVWLSGNALTSINVVTLRQTRLVPGWVTVCGRVNHLGM